MKSLSNVVALVLAITIIGSCLVTGCGSKKDKYIIGTDTVFAPFEMKDASGNYFGIDIDILDAVARDQGFAYELQALGFDACLTAVQAGEIDGMIAGMSIRPDREEIYDFSTPYFDSGVCCAVMDPGITKLEDLKGKTVAAKASTEGLTYANSIKDQYGFKSVVVYDDSAYMYEAVKVGDADACFEDYPVMGYGIAQGNGFHMITDLVKGSSYGFAVKKGKNAKLLEMFNKGFANIKANGTYQAILDKYIKAV